MAGDGNRLQAEVVRTSDPETERMRGGRKLVLLVKSFLSLNERMNCALADDQVVWLGGSM